MMLNEGPILQIVSSCCGHRQPRMPHLDMTRAPFPRISPPRVHVFFATLSRQSAEAGGVPIRVPKQTASDGQTLRQVEEVEGREKGKH